MNTNATMYRYISLLGGVREMDAISVIIEEDVRRDADARLLKLGRKSISWVDCA